MTGKQKKLRGQSYKPNKGLVPRGYDFLGPFNDMIIGPGRNEADEAARWHDIEYGKRGKSAYFKNTKADEEFIKNTENTPGYGRIANNLFKLKRKLAPNDYVTPPKKLRGSTQLGKRISPGELANAKRLKPTSLFNSTATTTMDGGGSGKDESGLKETPIDKVYDVHRGPPDYTFASLPWLQNREMITNDTISNDHSFRMTSPYDCVVDFVYSDINAGAGAAGTYTNPIDSIDTRQTTDKARWFDFYAGIYKYYSVVSCRWHLTFENLTNEMIYLHQMYYNDVPPPTDATNSDILLWNDCESHLVGTHAVSIKNDGTLQSVENGGDEMDVPENFANYSANNNVNRRGIGPVLQLSGEYRPGDYNRAIRLDENVENWNLTTTNPKLPERLLFRVRKYQDAIQLNNGTTYNRLLNYRYQIKIEYLVEFKELKTGLKYPVQRQPLVVTIQQDGSSIN